MRRARFPTLHCRWLGYASSLFPILPLCTVGQAHAGIAGLDGFIPPAPDWAVIGHLSGGALLALFMVSLLMLRARLRPRFALVDELLLGLLLLIGLAVGVVGLLSDPSAWPGGSLSGLLIAVPALLLGWRCHRRDRPGAATLLAGACVASVVPLWSALSGFAALAVPPMPPWSGLAGLIATLSFFVLILPLALSHQLSRRLAPTTSVRAGTAGGIPAGMPGVAAVGLSAATRPMLLERVEQGIARARRAEVGLALIWIEVQGMPDVERLLGEEVADRLLDTISDRLDRHLRVESMLARTGQYSFGAVCEAVTDIDEVLGIIAGLRDALLAPCDLGDGDIVINASFGHALFPADGADAAVLSRVAARRALRTAKTAMAGRPGGVASPRLRKVS